MNENAYRTRAERGEIQIGTWVTMIRTPAVLTLLKAAGLDFARLDMEHSPFSMETVADMATLARALDFPLVVRPPDGNREWITRLLDAGAGGPGRGLCALRPARRARHVRVRPAHHVRDGAARRTHGPRQRAGARH